jgi:hypothetical protein
MEGLEDIDSDEERELRRKPAVTSWGDQAEARIDPKTGVPEIRKEPFEIDYDLVQDLDWPEWTNQGSGYKEYEQQTGHPEFQFAMIGHMVMSDYLATFEQYKFVMEERPHCGKFFLSDRQGIPVAYVSVTFHKNNPLRYERGKRFRCWNPGKFPIYADMYDDRLHPSQITHTVCFSKMVQADEYRLVKYPPDQHNFPMKVWVTETEREYGQQVRPGVDLSEFPQIQKPERRSIPQRPNLAGISSLQAQASGNTPQSAVVTPSRRTEETRTEAKEEELLRKQAADEDVEMTAEEEADLDKVIESC